MDTINLSQFLIVASILACSSVIQGTVGFAAGLFGIPLLMLVGVDLPKAIMIMLIAATVQNALGAYRLRRTIDYPKTVLPTVLRLITVPVGAYLLLHTQTSVNPDRVKQIVGVVLLLVIGIDSLWQIKPRESLHVGWGYLAFSLSGLMAGFCGMGGPPLVVWVNSHEWPAVKARAFLFFVFLTGMLPHIVALFLIFGGRLWAGVLLGLLALPIVLAATSFGLWLGNMLSRQRLRRLTYLLLGLIAIAAIVGPYFKAAPREDMVRAHGAGGPRIGQRRTARCQRAEISHDSHAGSVQYEKSALASRVKIRQLDLDQ